ncbi:hypothetical protein GTZ99_05765 [Novosphingobium sp. FSY-8]|uniref:Uncharacterized protein n=1 Tax=Novosphingobium ovatum TaxID=1908523 RepID=A0ABW9XC45_9SPHN|nr:hypothetical protein [Novosphingobium ovatum]NBC36062.1 hypothetical protein [Novosphingobium ovatum]
MGSLTQNVNVANNMGQTAYVMVGLTPEWEIIDFLVSAAELALALADVAALPEAVSGLLNGLPATMETFADLAAFTKTVAQFGWRVGSAANHTQLAIKRAIDAFKQSSIAIPYGQVQNVSHMDLSACVNPSGIASFLGAETLQMIVMSEDSQYQANFQTGADDSWVLTNGRYFPRAQYGKLWVQDQSAGTVTWNACSLQTHLAWNQYWLTYYQNELDNVHNGMLSPANTTIPYFQLPSMIAMYQNNVANYQHDINTAVG